MQKLFKSRIFFVGALAVGFVFDRLGKSLALQMKDQWSDPGNHILAFGYYPNEGIGFGLPLSQVVIVSATVIILAGLIGWLIQVVRRREILQVWGLSLVLTGALNNFIDRIFFEHVIDYLKVFDWPIFNLADVLIISGAALVMLAWFRLSTDRHLQNK
ncbi:MAG: signal peptidase II [Patescibacteria group bacterium]|nr:signal peptidase II [Patescibacteria group bacterium]